MPSGHVVDANTVALWQFGGTSGTTVPDIGTNALDLTTVGSPTTEAGITGNGNALILNGTSSYAWRSYAVSDPIYSTFVSTTGWTIESWTKRTGGADGGYIRSYFFGASGSFPGETGTDNAICCFGQGALGSFHFFWERNFNDSGAASNAFNAMDIDVNFRYIPMSTWVHTAVRRSNGSFTGIGFQATVDFFINGILTYTSPAKYIAGVGTPLTTPKLAIARFHADSSLSSWSGSVDEVHVSNIARSDAYIKANALRPFGGGSGGGVNPTISNLTPAAGSALHPTSKISFDVTVSDNTPFRKIFLSATTDSSDIHELIWDGTAFTPFYTGSTITTANNGYHFDIRRNNGWTGRPKISVSAVTTQGGSL